MTLSLQKTFSFGMNYVVPVRKLSLVNMCVVKEMCSATSTPFPPKNHGTDGLLHNSFKMDQRRTNL